MGARLTAPTHRNLTRPLHSRASAPGGRARLGTNLALDTVPLIKNQGGARGDSAAAPKRCALCPTGFSLRRCREGAVSKFHPEMGVTYCPELFMRVRTGIYRMVSQMRPESCFHCPQGPVFYNNYRGDMSCWNTPNS